MSFFSTFLFNSLFFFYFNPKILTLFLKFLLNREILTVFPKRYSWKVHLNCKISTAKLKMSTGFFKFLLYSSKFPFWSRHVDFNHKIFDSHHFTFISKMKTCKKKIYISECFFPFGLNPFPWNPNADVNSKWNLSTTYVWDSEHAPKHIIPKILTKSNMQSKWKEKKISFTSIWNK